MSKNATVQRQKLKATYREQPNILLPLNENIIIGQDQLLTGCSDEFASQYLKYLGVADNLFVLIVKFIVAVQPVI